VLVGVVLVEATEDVAVVQGVLVTLVEATADVEVVHGVLVGVVLVEATEDVDDVVHGGVTTGLALTAAKRDAMMSKPFIVIVVVDGGVGCIACAF
jgi:hypothetical protein